MENHNLKELKKFLIKAKINDWDSLSFHILQIYYGESFLEDGAEYFLLSEKNENIISIYDKFIKELYESRSEETFYKKINYFTKQILWSDAFRGKQDISDEELEKHTIIQIIKIFLKYNKNSFPIDALKPDFEFFMENYSKYLGKDRDDLEFKEVFDSNFFYNIHFIFDYFAKDGYVDSIINEYDGKNIEALHYDEMEGKRIGEGYLPKVNVENMLSQYKYNSDYLSSNYD